MGVGGEPNTRLSRTKFLSTDVSLIKLLDLLSVGSTESTRGSGVAGSGAGVNGKAVN
jgi:hypothetical protein